MLHLFENISPCQVRLFSYYDVDGGGELSYAGFMRLLQGPLPVDPRAWLTVGEDRNTANAGHGGD